MPHIRPDEVVLSALQASDDGLPDLLNAERHGVAVKTIRRWRREYQRRGRDLSSRHPAPPCPRCQDAPLDEPAYAELFGWYLGDGYLSTGRRGVFNLHVYDDERYVVVNEHIEELMRRVKGGGRPHRRRLPGCLAITVSWKHWPCLLPQHGPGRKHARELGMQPWQWAIVQRHPGDFLRGLFHSDGCRVDNVVRRPLAGGIRTYHYPRWQFVNASAEIRQWCCDALDLVGVAWRVSGPRTISVSRRASVAALDDLIGLKS